MNEVSTAKRVTTRTAKPPVNRRKERKPLPSPLSLLILALNALMGIAFFSDWAGEATKRIDGADFTSFYTGWTMVHNGMGAQLYNIAAQTKVQTGIVHGTFPNGALVFCVPPFVAVLFSPLAALPINWARFVFALINMAMTGVMLRQIRHLMPGISRKQFARFAVFVISLSPLWSTITGGSLSVFVGAGVAGMLASLRLDRPTQAGLWIGLIAFKPQYLPFIAVFLISRRLWRTIATSVGTGAILAAISLPLGITPWVDFVKLLQRMGTVTVDFGVNAQLMWNIRALMTRLVRGHSLSTVDKSAYLGPQPAIIGIATTALLVVALVSLYRCKRFDLPTHAVLLIVLSAMFTLHGHHHDVIMLAIAIGILVGRLHATQSDNQFTKNSAVLYASSLALTVALFLSTTPLLFIGLLTMTAIGWYAIRLTKITTAVTPDRSTP
jgi:hypothetical protein